ncbi:MAG TPA: hypothetical protein VK890_13420, partial [Bacteroidia bacterium]|nr:hypothetical protein [Bacteroidia bacterium]
SVSGAFCYGGGLGFNYVVTKRLTLFLDADYMHSSPTYHVIEWSQGSNPVSGYAINTIKTVTQPFTIATITVGIGFKLPGLHFYN